MVALGGGNGGRGGVEGNTTNTPGGDQAAQSSGRGGDAIVNASCQVMVYNYSSGIIRAGGGGGEAAVEQVVAEGVEQARLQGQEGAVSIRSVLVVLPA